MASNSISRRRILGAAATAAGLTILPSRVLGRGAPAPSDTLNIAGIGVGGKGVSDLLGCAKHANVIALCDVDWKNAEPSFWNFPDAPRYRDFRELLDKEKDIDAVTVSTADHTHTLIALAALQAGKHVFCQKPLTRTLHEARTLADAARRSRLATQMGNQGHADPGTRAIREWIEAGVIGQVRQVEFWTNRPIWPQAIPRPTEAHHPPATLSWDLFLGPAPERPYHPAYTPFNWRGFWDFGTGALGDIACHAMDAAFWALDLRNPVRISAETTQLFAESAPACSRIVYEFAATPKRPALTVVWRDGGLLPPRPALYPDHHPWPGLTSGQLILGESGLIMADMYATEPRLYPVELHRDTLASPPSEKYPRTRGVYAEWIEACKSGTQPGSNFAGSNFPDHAGPLTELVLLGNLAVRSGEVIEWDAAKLEVTNVSSPNQYVRESTRKGWELEQYL